MRRGLSAGIQKGLREKGWHLGQLAPESSPEELSNIAGAIGTPVAPTGGRLVDAVAPMQGARYSTLSRRSVPPHNDGLFLPCTPTIVVLHAVHVPQSGGETLLIDAGHALRRLPAHLRDALSGMDVDVEAGGLAATRRLIADGPFGSVLLFLDPRISDAITLQRGGRPLDEGMLAGIRAACRGARKVLVHRWRAGDLLVFNNLAFLHARRAFRGSRRLRRVLVLPTGLLPRG